MMYSSLGGDTRVSPSQRPASYSEVLQHRKMRSLSRAFCIGVSMTRARTEKGVFATSGEKQEAVSLGLKHYQPNEPCKNGHVAKRFVSNGGCSECLKIGVRKYQSENRDVLLIKKSEWAKKNKDKNLAQSLRWYRENTEKAIRLNKESKKRNWGSTVMAGRRATSKRRAALILRLPKWANMKLIRDVYDKCPEGMVVDHIIPLQGKNVSGLHVETNLQYLSFVANAKKGAKFNG